MDAALFGIVVGPANEPTHRPLVLQARPVENERVGTRTVLATEPVAQRSTKRVLCTFDTTAHLKVE